MEQEPLNEITLTIGIFGDNFELVNLMGQGLGAPGTKSDMLFFNRLDASLGQIFCAITPVDYPDKIKPFLQILTLTKIHVLVIDVEKGLNASVGEILVGMDMFHQERNSKSLIAISGITEKNEWKLSDLEKKLKNVLNTTSLSNSSILKIKTKEDIDDIKEFIVELATKSPSEKENKPYTKVLIDHAFPVKGIGTVILGIIMNGTIKANQMLELTGFDGPSKKVIIRSIQKNDRDFKEANEGDRVGLALKGNLSVSEISRDNLLATPGIFKVEKQIEAMVKINPFYKPKQGFISPNDNIQYHAIVELKSSPFKFMEGNPLKPGESGELTMKLDRMLYHDGSGLKGIITEMNKFENKLRIVGSFSQIEN